MGMADSSPPKKGNDMKNTIGMTDCKACRSALADLLLDESYATAHPELVAHMSECVECRTELAELKATFALMDTWAAPEPSAYFDSKLHARLREAEAAGPEGLWERFSSFLKFSTGRHLRPAMTAALAAVLVLGGAGTLIGVYPSTHTNQAMSPTVNDLKILDNNAQAIQQMDQLLDDSSSSSDDAPPTT
jgi:anti-sigma factor RsiW